MGRGAVGAFDFGELTAVPQPAGLKHLGVRIVENRVVLGKQHVETGRPKSKASRRTLPLPDDAVQVLKAASGSGKSG